MSISPVTEGLGKDTRFTIMNNTQNAFHSYMTDIQNFKASQAATQSPLFQAFERMEFLLGSNSTFAVPWPLLSSRTWWTGQNRLQETPFAFELSCPSQTIQDAHFSILPLTTICHSLSQANGQPSRAKSWISRHSATLAFRRLTASASASLNTHCIFPNTWTTSMKTSMKNRDNETNWIQVLTEEPQRPRMPLLFLFWYEKYQLKYVLSESRHITFVSARRLSGACEVYNPFFFSIKCIRDYSLAS